LLSFAALPLFAALLLLGPRLLFWPLLSQPPLPKPPKQSKKTACDSNDSAIFVLLCFWGGEFFEVNSLYYDARSRKFSGILFPPSSLTSSGFTEAGGLG
ncbi:MAG: hypothetical protein WA609_20180, partial [Terriglobales bacterium]